MRRELAVWALAVGTLLGIQSHSYGQAAGEAPMTEAVAPPDIDALKQSWQSLSAQDFIKSAKEIAKDRAKWEPAVLTAFREAYIAESVRKLTETDIVASEPYVAVTQLVTWAGGKLTPEQKQALRERLAARSDHNAELGFDEMQGKFRALRRLSASDTDFRKPVQEWLAGRDLSLLTLPQLEWCADAVSITPGYINTSLSARWTGSLRPPRDGQYKFSGSPIQINLKSINFWANSSMKVWVDGQLVLDTTKPDAAPQAVSLSANKASDLRVEFTHAHLGNRIQMQHPPIAMLYWEGEGLGRQLVPSSALTPPDGKGTGPGLLGEYTVTRAKDKEGNEQPPLVTSRIDPQISFAWTNAQSILLANPAEAAPLINEIASRYTQAEYLGSVHEQMGKNRSAADGHHWQRVAELMTPAQRAQMLQAISGDEGLLKQLSPYRIKRAFQIFRPGAEVESVDLIGKWAQTKAPVEPVFTKFYYRNNRSNYFVLADYLTYEYPQGAPRLEEKYLETPEGGCALDVAYILAYSHGLKGTLDDWIAKLDGKLNNESIAGEARINWLLARAQAEEIRGSTPQRFTLFPERHSAGWGWLDEASLMAASEPAKLRVFREKLTRLVAQDQREAAQQLITENESRFNSPESQEALAKWKETIKQIAEQYDKAKVAQVKRAHAAHVKELERRLKAAEANGDEGAIARYQQKLDALADEPHEQ